MKTNTLYLVVGNSTDHGFDYMEGDCLVELEGTREGNDGYRMTNGDDYWWIPMRDLREIGKIDDQRQQKIINLYSE